MDIAKRPATWTSSRIIALPSPSNRAVPVLTLAIADLLAALCSLLAVNLITRPMPDLMPWLLASFLAFWMSLAIRGVYPGRGMFGPERVRLRALSSLLAFLPTAIAACWCLGDIAGTILRFAGCGLCLFFLSAFFETVAICTMVRRNVWCIEAMVVGEPNAAKRVKLDLELFPELGLKAIDQSADDKKGDSSRLLALSHEGEAGTEYLVDISAPLPAFYSIPCSTSHFAVRETQAFSRIVKRLIDITGALFLLIFASPLILVATVLILIHDGQPLFFCQQRGGKNRMIGVLKFRSMYRDAPQRLESVLIADPEARAEWNRFFKLSHDPRILPVVGNFIRKTSIDELPQLWNILKGEMSLIGPRPFPENHLSAFSREFCALRQTVQPGLSGLWQVTLRSDGDLEMQERLDTAYIQGWSIWLDLYILLRTPIVLVSSRGAR